MARKGVHKSPGHGRKIRHAKYEPISEAGRPEDARNRTPAGKSKRLLYAASSICALIIIVFIGFLYSQTEQPVADQDDTGAIPSNDTGATPDTPLQVIEPPNESREDNDLVTAPVSSSVVPSAGQTETPVDPQALKAACEEECGETDERCLILCENHDVIREAADGNDLDLCSQLSQEAVDVCRDEVYLRRSYLEDSIDLCENIINAALKATCHDLYYYNKALGTGESSYCAEINEESMRLVCEGRAEG